MTECSQRGPVSKAKRGSTLVLIPSFSGPSGVSSVLDGATNVAEQRADCWSEDDQTGDGDDSDERDDKAVLDETLRWFTMEHCRRPTSTSFLPAAL